MPAIPAIITSIATVGGSYIAAKGNKDAAKTQAASDDKALAQAKEIYEQQRADQGPYRQSGYGSLNALNFGLGLPEVQLPSNAPATPATTAAPKVPSDSQGRPLSTGQLDVLSRASSSQGPSGTYYMGHVGVMKPGMVANSGFVKVQSPSGTVHLVPPDKVEQAKQNGGTVVS